VQGSHTEGAGEPADRPGASGEPHRVEAVSVRRVVRPDRSGALALWLGWLRTQPLLAVALLGFCVAAAVGLVMSLPSGILPAGRTTRPSRSTTEVAPTDPRPVAPRESPASRGPNAPAPDAPSAQPGPWIEEAPSPPSARGLALVYRHRTLPPGSESRYQWIVQVRGARPVLEGIDVVTWRMDPAAKDDGDLTSRDRAADGFPLFGDGPGGWFGVSAGIRFRDGTEETLSRRVELPD
jgi:hypothetical protein